MKRSIFRVISLCVIALVLLLALAAGYFTELGYGISVGRYLPVAGGHMLILNHAPICVSNYGKDTMFQNLSAGDRILLVHDGIAETYPGQTSGYFCLRLSHGQLTDIPQAVLDSLRDLGWYCG